MSPPDEPRPSSTLPALLQSCRQPWDIHPALTEDRLRACVLLLAHARRDAVRLAIYDMDDDSWSVRCRAYAFGRQRLRRFDNLLPNRGSDRLYVPVASISDGRRTPGGREEPQA